MLTCEARNWCEVKRVMFSADDFPEMLHLLQDVVDIFAVGYPGLSAAAHKLFRSLKMVHTGSFKQPAGFRTVQTSRTLVIESSIKP
jgi:hypothetical protein